MNNDACIIILANQWAVFLQWSCFCAVYFIYHAHNLVVWRDLQREKTFWGFDSNTSRWSILGFSSNTSCHALSPSWSLSCVSGKGLPRRWAAGCFNIISVIRWGHRQVHRWLASKGWAHAKSLAPLQALCLNSLHLASDDLFIFPFFLLLHFARLQLCAHTEQQLRPCFSLSLTLFLL